MALGGTQQLKPARRVSVTRNGRSPNAGKEGIYKGRIPGTLNLKDAFLLLPFFSLHVNCQWGPLLKSKPFK